MTRIDDILRHIDDALANLTEEIHSSGGGDTDDSKPVAAAERGSSPLSAPVDSVSPPPFLLWLGQWT